MLVPACRIRIPRALLIAHVVADRWQMVRAKAFIALEQGKNAYCRTLPVAHTPLEC
jgi:hypothetical protein